MICMKRSAPNSKSFGQLFLPPVLRQRICAQLVKILEGDDESGRYDYLLPLERKRIRSILAATKPDVLASSKR